MAPDCKSGRESVRWFESIPAHHYETSSVAVERHFLISAAKVSTTKINNRGNVTLHPAVAIEYSSAKVNDRG